MAVQLAVCLRAARHPPQPQRGVVAAMSWRCACGRRGDRQREEGAGLLECGAQGGGAEVEPQELEQVTALTGRGVHPPPRNAGGCEPHVERAALGAVDVAHRPVPPLLAPAGEIAAADLLGTGGERRGERRGRVLAMVRWTQGMASSWLPVSGGDDGGDDGIATVAVM